MPFVPNLRGASVMDFLVATARSGPRAAVGSGAVPTCAEASRRRVARAASGLAALAALVFAPSPADDDAESAIQAPDPYLGLDSPSVQEGDCGTTALTFTARLRPSSAGPPVPPPPPRGRAETEITNSSTRS